PLPFPLNPLRLVPGSPPMPRVVLFWRVTAPVPRVPGRVATSFPALTFVPPAYVLLAGEEYVRVWVPVPTLVSDPPVPVKMPAKESVALPLPNCRLLAPRAMVPPEPLSRVVVLLPPRFTVPPLTVAPPAPLT